MDSPFSERFPPRSRPTEHVVNGREQFGDNAFAASTNAASSMSTQRRGRATPSSSASRTIHLSTRRRGASGTRVQGVDRSVRFPLNARRTGANVRSPSSNRSGATFKPANDSNRSVARRLSTTSSRSDDDRTVSWAVCAAT